MLWMCIWKGNVRCLNSHNISYHFQRLYSFMNINNLNSDADLHVLSMHIYMYLVQTESMRNLVSEISVWHPFIFVCQTLELNKFAGNPTLMIWWIRLLPVSQIKQFLKNLINIRSRTTFFSEISYVHNMSRLVTKPAKWHVCPAKTQISLGIRPVWSVFAVHMKKAWVLSYPLSAQRDSDQTGRMPRLIWVFAGRTVILLVLSCRGSYV